MSPTTYILKVKSDVFTKCTVHVPVAGEFTGISKVSDIFKGFAINPGPGGPILASAATQMAATAITMAMIHPTKVAYRHQSSCLVVDDVDVAPGTILIRMKVVQFSFGFVQYQAPVPVPTLHIAVAWM